MFIIFNFLVIVIIVVLNHYNYNIILYQPSKVLLQHHQNESIAQLHQTISTSSKLIPIKIKTSVDQHQQNQHHPHQFTPIKSPLPGHQWWLTKSPVTCYQHFPNSMLQLKMYCPVVSLTTPSPPETLWATTGWRFSLQKSWNCYLTFLKTQSWIWSDMFIYENRSFKIFFFQRDIRGVDQQSKVQPLHQESGIHLIHHCYQI